MSLSNDKLMIGWSTTDDVDADETVYLNPLARDFVTAVEMNPDVVDTADWDFVESTLSSPETVGVNSVKIDYDTGLVEIEEDSSVSRYFLAAMGEKGSFSVVDEKGNVSTSNDSSMPLKHHSALVEAVGGLDLEPDTRELDVSLDQSWTDVYNDIMDTGTYEALDGDVVLNGFDSTGGAKIYESDDTKARRFIEQLDDIAEFYRDFEDDWDITDQSVDLNMPITPERRSRSNSYKFRARGTDKDVNIVVSRDYDSDSSSLELEVLAFGDHNSDANLY